MEVVDVSEPRAGEPGHVVVRPETIGICGSGSPTTSTATWAR